MIRPLLRVFRTAPVTTSYVAAVAGVAGVTALLGSEAAEAVARAVSTDLQHLRTAPELVLPASAFVLEHPGQVVVLPMLAVSMGLMERRYGSVRTACTFAAGHVGATLVVAGGLATGIAAGWIDPAHAQVVDVGVSYGAWALWGALAPLVPARLRAVYIGASTGLLVGLLIMLHNFTDVGHLLAWGIGLAIGAGIVRSAAAAPAAGRGPTATPTPAH